MLRFRGSEPLSEVLDQHLWSRVSEKTLLLYKNEGRLLADWLRSVGLEPDGFEEWDDALVEYKNNVPLSVLASRRCWLA